MTAPVPAPVPEPTYTLAEAKVEIARQMCASQGHDLATGFLGTYTPSAISCVRCGMSWTLTAK
jgi:hypothetical protein